MTQLEVQERRYKKFCFYRDTCGYRETWDTSLYKRYDCVISLSLAVSGRTEKASLDACRVLFLFENWAPS